MSIEIAELEKTYEFYKLLNYIQYIEGQFNLVNYYQNKFNLFIIHRKQMRELFLL